MTIITIFFKALNYNVILSFALFELSEDEKVYLNVLLQVEEVKPLTNQKESGRCWLFACLNAMRIPFIKAHQVIIDLKTLVCEQSNGEW
jgi:aminopeptidase C